MKNTFILVWVGTALQFSALAQDLSSFAPKPPSNGLPSVTVHNSDNCQKDSTLITDAQNVVSERILYRYTANSETRLRFRRATLNAPLTLFSVDSFQFDADHRLIYAQNVGQLQGNNGQLLPYLDRQTFYAPCPTSGPCVADSVVTFAAQLPFSDLKPSFKEVNTYDAQGRVAQTVSFSPDNDFLAFQFFNRKEYEYDSVGGQLLRIKTSVFIPNDGWVLSETQTYTYTPDGTLASTVEAYADGIPISRSIFSNNPGLNFHQTEFSYWNQFSGGWNQPFTRTRNYKDASDRPLALVLSVNSISLQGADSTFFEYVPGSDCVQFITRYGRLGSPQFQFAGKTTHFYNGISSTSLTPETWTYAIYPNPAQNDLTVEGAQGGWLQLISPDGKIVFQQIITAERERMQLPPLKPGVYFLQVQRNGRQSAKTLVIQQRK